MSGPGRRTRPRARSSSPTWAATMRRALRDRFGDIGSETDSSGSHVLINLFEAAILGADPETAFLVAATRAMRGPPCG